MPCAFCGEGDRWIKTCRGLIRVCDPCWEALPRLVIVPRDEVVTARCDLCGRYSNPREMTEVSPGGRYDAYAGTCGKCAEEGAQEVTREAIEGVSPKETTERGDREEDPRLHPPLQGLLVRWG